MISIYGLVLSGCVIITSIIYILVKYATYKNRKFWEAHGIPILESNVSRTIFGIINKVTLREDMLTQYNILKSKSYPMGGYRNFGPNTVLLYDLDVIKRIYTTDFDHFPNRIARTALNEDPHLHKLLLHLEGDEWKSVRSTLSPAFTNSKIRSLFPIFESSCTGLVNYLKAEVAQSEDSVIDLNLALKKYIIDVISAAAFGLNSASLESRNPSVFEEMGDKLFFQLDLKFIIQICMVLEFPNLSNFLKVRLLVPEADQFFSRAVMKALEFRRNNPNTEIRDFLQLVIDSMDRQQEDILNNNTCKKNSVKWDDDMIAAQSLMFIVAGYNTTQSLLIFVVYQLALCPEVQERLCKEVNESWERTGGSFSYESIWEMEYMDKVINDRTCNKTYEIPELSIVIPKGTWVQIPICSIHLDDDYYPDPEKFDPERFSPEGKKSRPAFAFMPFGYGPRSCIGYRFALTEVKLAVAHLLHEFIFEPCRETTIPMKFANIPLIMPANGMKLKLRRR